MKLELNNEEAQVLVNLLNVALKATGIDGLDSVKHFIDKIKAASSEGEQNEPESNPTETSKS